MKLLRNSALLLATNLAPAACQQAECSNPDYGNPDCRVLAENELARLGTPGGVELRFQPPGADLTGSWIAGGHFRQIAPDRVRARVAGPGSFAISIEAGGPGSAPIVIELANVDPAAIVSVGPPGAELELPAPTSGATVRDIAIDFADGPVVWIRGRRPCPSRFSLAFTADIQTNPGQFARIAERLREESRAAAATDAPLVGLVIAGDLAEAARDDEYEAVAEILQGLPIPTAVTAGNHDIFRPLHPQFNRNFGPGNYTFDVCDAHVAMLDSGSGAIARSVMARLPEFLDRGDARYLLAVMHHPPHPGTTGAGWSREDMAQILLAELALNRADLIVAGHNHALHDFPGIRIGDVGLHEVIVGTAGALQGTGTPRYGYLRVTFGDGVSACFVEVPPAGYDRAANKPLRTLDYCDD